MNWLRGELYTFLLAVQFLTRVPLPNWPIYTPERFGASVRHYPTVGLFIGAFSAGVLATASVLLPPLVAVLLSFAATIALTGAFHEDGLADMFDGVGGGNDRNAILEIMKDSRIGVYGACGLVSVLAIKAATLWELTRPLGITGVCLLLVATHALSRWSAVVVIATSTYLRGEGSGKSPGQRIPAPALLFTTVVAAACVAGLFRFFGPPGTASAVVGLVLGHATARFVFERRLGGYTGDCLGATQQLSEIGLYLGVLAWL